MKIAFFGTPLFAAKLLEHLATKVPQHQIVAVVSKPDKPKGRGQMCQMTPVHEIASKLLPGVPYLQPEKASAVIAPLESIGADLFVVVAYGEIVKKELLDLPKYGCVNVHASLLPLLRGAAPIQRAIMDGFSKTGITIMRMNEGMDTGDMIVKKEVPIDKNDSFLLVEERLLHAAQEGLVEALDAIEAKRAIYTPQDHTKATKANKITEKDLLLDPASDVQVVHNTIRALSPKPGAYFQVFVRNKPCRLKVLESRVGTGYSESPVFQMREDRLALVNRTGELILYTIQPEGKARMSSQEFLRGYPIPTL